MHESYLLRPPSLLFRRRLENHIFRMLFSVRPGSSTAILVHLKYGRTLGYYK